MKNLDEYHVSEATHKLKCRHAIGRSGFNYTMPCLIIGRTKSRMLKIVVFGDRYWKHRDDRKRIRYVPPWDVIPIEARP